MNIVFSFVSKNTEFQMPDLKSHGYSTHRLTFDYRANNTLALPTIYNMIIDEYSSTNDFIVLSHADVRFDIYKFVDHLSECSMKYDVMGLCGCSKISVSQHPFNWFCGSRPFPEHRWGCVSHGELNNQTSFFSCHHPDELDHEVACIDGLCIILSKRAIDKGLRFDESLGRYNVYDTDISFQTVMRYNMKLGVLVTKDLKHYSVGKSILGPEFADDEVRLRAKWNI